MQRSRGATIDDLTSLYSRPIETPAVMRERCACGAEFEYALGSNAAANDHVVARYRGWGMMHAACMDVARSKLGGVG